jgi:hypothetical protein
VARSLNDLYNFYRYIVRKERGVFVTIPQFNANMDAGNLDAFMEYFKGYGADQQIHDALRVFKVYQPFTSTSAGFVTYPSDYFHLLGNPFTVAGSTVNTLKFVNEDELSFALTSQQRPVTNAYPIGVDTSTGFSIYPQSTQTGAYFYLRRPASPVLAYTQSGRTITYNSAGSTQLEWEEVYWNNILAKALRYAGVNMDEKGISDFANQYNAETQ